MSVQLSAERGAGVKERGAVRRWPRVRCSDCHVFCAELCVLPSSHLVTGRGAVCWSCFVDQVGRVPEPWRCFSVSFRA